MEQQTISQVSKTYDISARMLRYYEQIGLLMSLRNEDNSYRAYDEAAQKRIQQIVILRKLQIPVKQIGEILDNPAAIAVVEVFKEKIAKVDQEISALSVIKSILEVFLVELEKTTAVRIDLDLLSNASMQKLCQSLSLTQKNIKERLNMDELSKAADILNKLHDVRVIYLPPMAVASAYFGGENSETRAWQSITDFIRQCDLLQIKPDLRVFKINHSNAIGQNFGFEIWVSIPEDFPVPTPLAKKRFLGGQYAAHVLGDTGFEVILGLQDWVNENDKYQADYDGNLTRCEPPIKEIDGLGGMWLDLQEVLNVYNYQNPGFEAQLDHLQPIKNYEPSESTPVEIAGSKERCGFKASIVTKGKFKIMGFTKIITQGNSPDMFERELMADGRLDLLNKCRKPGAPIVSFGSHDMDSQMRGGWRWSICLLESDITDVPAFLEHNPYMRTIDASRWLIFERTVADAFDDHAVCMKLGYTWNGIISGSITAMPNGKIGKPDPNDKTEMNSIVYCWYPVK